MSERYDEAAAAHYAAYRPPLHAIILQRTLGDSERFTAGLDVGCGTGYSAVALAEHCARVHALDPSPAMLSRAIPHERVGYLGGAGERIPLADRSADVVTLAGVLHYADPAATRAEIGRVGREGGVVVVYDFEVLLDETLRRCGVELPPDVSDYDHRACFPDDPGLTTQAAGSERLALEPTAAQLAHLLLSDSHRLDRFVERYSDPDPFPTLARELDTTHGRATIEAEIYYRSYRLGAPSHARPGTGEARAGT